MKRNVREQKIRERGVNHENHENIMPRKFGAIRYLVTLKGRTHSTYVTFTSHYNDAVTYCCHGYQSAGETLSRDFAD